MSARKLRVTQTRRRPGDGYSGAYRNVWLRTETAGGSVRVTASPTSPLGTMPRGATVDLAAWMTGMVDVADSVYYARHAQLLAWAVGAPQPAGA
jgi:hypothetical protein